MIGCTILDPIHDACSPSYTLHSPTQPLTAHSEAVTPSLPPLPHSLTLTHSLTHSSEVVLGFPTPPARMAAPDFDDARGLPPGKQLLDYWDGQCCALMTSYDAPKLHKRCTTGNLAW